MEQTVTQPETSEQTTKRAWVTPRLRTEAKVAEITLMPVSGP